MNRVQRTDEEVRADYIEKMGPELGELFDAISSELTWLHWRWQQYRILFGDKPSRIEILNESASFFFRIIHDVLFEDTLLAIARLCGPSKSAGNQNLSIERFSSLLSDMNLRNQVQKLVEQARAAAAFAIEWRNRRIAHHDLDLSFGKTTRMLPIATREKVEQCLSALREVVNYIEGAFCNATTCYSFSPSGWDAKALLHTLRDGLLRQKERRETWMSGKPHADDLNRLPEI